MKTLILILLLLTILAFCVGHWAGWRSGREETTNALFAHFSQKYGTGRCFHRGGRVYKPKVVIEPNEVKE